MGTSRFVVSCAWWNRAEPEGSCARRTARVLGHLAGLGFPPERWDAAVQEGPDHQPTFRHVPMGGIGVDRIEATTRRDTRFGDIGDRFAAAQGTPGGPFVSISLRCGGTSIGNHLMVDVTTGDARVEVVLSLLRTAVEAFEPNFAMASPSPPVARLEDMEAYTAPVGRPHRAIVEWITFLAAERGTVPPLPAGVRVLSKARGTYVVLAEDPATATPDLVERVTDILLAAGLLTHPDDM